jgi:succinate dehydrogenase/fumarate reductase flavoprotein subunit
MSDETVCDVLVVGSGAAAFAAAISARHQGLDVLMVEKAPVFGGTTAYSAGVIWIPGSSHARNAGLSEPAGAALTYLESSVGNRLDRAKAEAFLAAGPTALDFLEANTHVRYQVQSTWADYEPDLPGASQGGRSLLPEPFDGRRLGARFNQLRTPISTMMLLGGMMVGRDDIPHMFNVTRSLRSALHVTGLVGRFARDRLRYRRGTRVANGNALIAALALSAGEKGIPLWLSSPLVRLTLAGGRVVGGVVRRESREVAVKARNGVVLAAGGFPAADDLRKRLYPHVAGGTEHRSLPPESNTGDGIRLGMSAGAAFTQDVHHAAAWTPVSLVPQPDGGIVPFPHFIDRGKPGYIAVDRRGQRFVNEAKSYHVFVPAMIEACRADQRVECWLITDHLGIRRYGLGAAAPSPMPLGPHLRSGYIISGGTIGDLASRLGIERDGLRRTIEEYNGPARQGDDPAFGKGSDAYQRFNGAAGHAPNPCVAPIERAPFYAVRLVPGDIGTFAGLSTDPATRVLNDRGEPIRGLYAVGNDMASVMGGTYPGAGITIGPALTFGYIAGCSIAADVDALA